MKNYTLITLSMALVFSSATLAQPGCTVTATVTLTDPDCGASNGAVMINASGGTAPYTYYLLGNVVPSAYNDGLASGVYDYWVQDMYGCWWKSDFTLGCVPPDKCMYRSQTPGGWGAPPNGNNPGMYLQNHFAACFPTGIVIGCATGYTLELTSSNAVKVYLPSGGTPKMLTSDLVDPGKNYKNVLAGHLVAATITLALDACEPSFSPSAAWVGDVTYNSGTFTGWTVSQVVDAANDFIGGCGGSYSASQFNAGLTMFNENYVDGTTDNGNFDCGVVKKSVTRSNVGLELYPNPASDVLYLNVDLEGAGSGLMMVTDLMGRTIMQSPIQSTEAGARQLNLNVAELATGTYTLVITFNGSIKTNRFVVKR